MVTKQILTELINRLVEGFQPEKIILFGSQARGTADDHSDVDILVVCPVKGSRRTLALNMYRALKGLGIAKDIIILTEEEFKRNRQIPGTIARPAWLEGKVLYDRSQS